MVVGIVWTLRPNTTTNTCGHAYSLNTTPNPDEETYTATRYYQKFDLSTWDEVSSVNLQGVTADGSIVRAQTVPVGANPDNPE